MMVLTDAAIPGAQAAAQQSGKRKISDERKPSWEQPDNVKKSSPTEAGELAKKHGISPERAQMLIDRLGHNPEELAIAAEGLRINPGR